LRKLTRAGFEHLRLQLVSLRHQPVEHTLWLPHEGSGKTQLPPACSCQAVFVIAEQFFEYREQSTCTGLFAGGRFGQQTQSFVLETDFNAVGAECALVLPEQTSLGILHDVEKVIAIQVFTHDAHWQSTDEFRFESIFDKI